MPIKRWKSRLFFLMIFLCLLAPAIGWSGQNDFNVIDTPKTYTSYRGDMRFNFSMYDGGGVLGSAILSISDYAFLGVYFDIGKLIGSNGIEWNQPGVIARFLVSDGTTAMPPIAIGYSYFMKGDISKVDGITVNGIYIVSSQSFFLFGSEHNLSYGIQYPVVPLSYSRLENVTLFVGTDIEVSPQFSVKGEIENIFLSRKRWNEVFYNFSVDFDIADLISLSFECKFSPSINRFVRMLSIGYMTQF